MNRTLSGSIALTKLKHQEISLSRNDAIKSKVRGIFIPIDHNFLVEGENGAIYMPIRVHIREIEDQYGQHGFVSQAVDSKTFKDASEFEKERFRKLPILGNLKDFGSSQDDSSGKLHDDFLANSVDFKDDLPY